MQNQPISQSDTANERELTALELDIINEIDSIAAPDTAVSSDGLATNALALPLRDLIRRRLKVEVTDAAVNGWIGRARREIDEHRKGAGREAYNEARRIARFARQLEETGQVPRSYEKASPERRLEQLAAAQSKVRSKKSTAQQSAERKARRDRATLREVEASLKGRAIF